LSYGGSDDPLAADSGKTSAAGVCARAQQEATGCVTK